MHRDIKPDNILVFSKNEQFDLYKIGDFGICRDVKSLNTHTAKGKFTELYASPE